jgi:hypothetical protein
VIYYQCINDLINVLAWKIEVIKVDKLILNKSFKRGRGRPVEFSDELKRSITQQKELHPDWSAQKILDTIHKNLFQAYKQAHPLWSDSDIEQVIKTKIKIPALNTVQVYLNPHKKKSKVETQVSEKTIDIDSPWHLGLLSNPKFSISTEAISFIQMVQTYADNNPDSFGNPHPPLSFRQALWVSRLCGGIQIVNQKDIKKLLFSIAHYLYQWSEAYATRERICELSRTNFDTTHLDKMFRSGGEPITVNKTVLTHYRRDNSIEIDTIDDELIAKMEKGVANER